MRITQHKLNSKSQPGLRSPGTQCFPGGSYYWHRLRLEGQSRSVGQISSRHIRCDSYGRVEDARGIAEECVDAAAGVLTIQGIAKERLNCTGRVLLARGVAKKCINSVAGVEVANGIVNQ